MRVPPADSPATETNEIPSDPAEPIVNVAAYRFVALDRLEERRRHLKSQCVSLGLKGTILLSPEGINLFLAGSRSAVDAFLDDLRRDEPFAGIAVKESFSEFRPFARMKVKRKREIIPFGIEEVDPRRSAAPRLTPTVLKTWLDEGRDVVLLDVRNDYEIEHGTFAAAKTLPIGNFRDLPEAVATLNEDLRQRPVVTFCTGGIRCEKAAPYLQQQGFDEVYQLEGGILKYFEDCGGDHYQGNCFVFDERVAVDARLRPVGEPTL